MVECPRCKAQWPSGTLKCPTDGTSLTGRFTPRPPPSAGGGDLHDMKTATGPIGDFGLRPSVTAPSRPKPRFDEPPTVLNTVVKLPVDPLIGTKVGEYEVQSRLGEGGMGLVYRARQPLIGKQVAIKVLRPELAGDAEHMRRFLDEARAVNAVKHPALVDIFSFGELPGGGGQYFVMELLEGEPLSELMKRRGVMPAGEAVPILEQMAAGLEAAHQAGVVHRDIKPSNVFLTKLPEGRLVVKLLDFGLAKMTKTAPGVSVQNVAVGTPEYMSPEQATASTLTPATDVYALGCLMYEVLTGSVPFEAKSPVEVMMKQVRETPRAPSRVDPSVSPDLEKLVLKMMEKQPTLRPSAREVRLELGRVFRALGMAQTRVRGSPVTPAASAAVPAMAAKTERTEAATQRSPSVRMEARSSSRWLVIIGALIAAAAGFALAFKFWR